MELASLWFRFVYSILKVTRVNIESLYQLLKIYYFVHHRFLVGLLAVGNGEHEMHIREPT
jgi:hypothetical protein